METCCGKRRDTYGEEYISDEVEQQERELRGLLRLVAIVPFDEDLYQCTKCGQYWTRNLESEEGRYERPVYRKTTLDEFKSKHPNAEFDQDA